MMQFFRQLALQKGWQRRHLAPVVKRILVPYRKRGSDVKTVLAKDTAHGFRVVEVDMLHVDNWTPLAEKSICPSTCIVVDEKRQAARFENMPASLQHLIGAGHVIENLEC